MKILVFDLPIEHGAIGHDCAAGFEEMGHVCKTITFGGDSGADYPIGDFDKLRLIKEVMEFRPDFILSMNQIGMGAKKGEDGILLKVFGILKIPVFVWYIDDPAGTTGWRDYKAETSPYTMILIFDAYLAEMARGLYGDRVFHLPLGTNPKRFKKIYLTPEELTIYNADVSFVGRLDLENALKYKAALKETLQDAGFQSGLAEELLGRMIAKRNQDLLKPLEELMQEALIEMNLNISADNFGNNLLRSLGSVIDFVCGTYRRMEVINGLSGFNIKVCGDSDWLKMIARANYLTPVFYNTELAKIYNASDVNLNISRVQLKTTVNQRVFDVPACRAFLITDYREELEEYFEIEEEIVCYRNINELKVLIDYYLHNPGERGRIAEAGYQRVIKGHTYVHRMKGLIDIYDKRFRLGEPAAGDINPTVHDEKYAEAINLLRELHF